MRKFLRFSSIFSLLFLTSCSFDIASFFGPSLDGVKDYTVVKTVPHNTNYYTQGFEVLEGSKIVESGGNYGSSKVRIFDIEDGLVSAETFLGNEVFAEGLTVVDDSIYQFTWKEKVVYEWDKNLELVSTSFIDSEVWGVCYDDSSEKLWMSDGSSRLFLLDKDNFEILGYVNVTHPDGSNITLLNELECVNGEIYSNIYTTNTVVKIDSIDGTIKKIYDFSELEKTIVDSGHSLMSGEVLNGIAYDSVKDLWYFTGKNWPKVFVLRLE